MKQIFFFITLITFLICCKKKEATPDSAPNNNGSATFVNGYFLLYKNYDFTIIGNDTLFSKSYEAVANVYNTPVNIKNDIGDDVYSGTLYANSDTLFYSQSMGYVSYPTPPVPPITWGFTNSSVFGSNSVTVNDTCINISKINAFAIHKNISLSQNFVFDLTTINTPFEQCMISYYNPGTGQSGIQAADYGAPSITFPASGFAHSAPDSIDLKISLIKNTYKTVDGKSILFRNIGVFTKTVHITP